MGLPPQEVEESEGDEDIEDFEGEPTPSQQRAHRAAADDDDDDVPPLVPLNKPVAPTTSSAKPATAAKPAPAAKAPAAAAPKSTPAAGAVR